MALPTFLWHYPPTFQLVAALLAKLPYVVSYLAFVVFSIAVFVLAVRPLVPWREAAVLLVALPGTFICVLHGQNSLLSAALIATAIILIDRRPIVAGLCIGLLAYKPQLGALFPLVLAITGRWRVLGAAAATVLAYAAIATMVFGPGLWLTFLADAPVVKEVVETGQLPWSKMPSGYVFLRMLGAGQSTALAAQAVVAATVVAVTVAAWWRSGPTLPAGAVLVSGTLLLTPYTFDYEMALLAVPLAIIAQQVIRRGARKWEGPLLLALAASPLLMGAVVDRIGVQFGFLALVATFAWSAALVRESAMEKAEPGKRGLTASC